MSNKQNELKNAIQNNDLNTVKLLLESNIVYPAYNNNYPIQLASQKGHLNIVKLLLSDQRVDFTDCNYAAFRLAATNGHIEIMKLFIQDHKFDCLYYGNIAISFSMTNKCFEIVDLLWKNKLVKQSLRKNNFKLYTKLIQKELKSKIIKFLNIFDLFCYI